MRFFNVATLLFSLVFFSICASAAPPCSNVVIPAGMTALRNTAVTVPIDVDDLTSLNAISFDYTFTYNPATLTYTGFDQSATVGSALTITINSNTAGTLVVSGYNANPMAGAGTLIKLNFTASGPIGSTSGLNLPAFMFNEGNPCSSVSNGSITIVSGAVSGVVGYANAPSFTPVPNTVLNAPGSPNVSGNSTFITGAYSLNGFGPGSYTVTPSKVGDVNGITAFDSGLIAQYVVNLIPLTPTQLQAADVSQAAGVTSFDAGLIARYVVNLPNFGITGDWIFNPASRFYSSLETNQVNQDYSGILMGEVSGNWTAPTSFAPSAAPEAALPEVVATVAQHFTPRQNVHRGENSVIVPIDTSNLSFATTGIDVISYQFILTYDPAVLTPLSPAVTAGGTLSENGAVTINQLTPGILEVDYFRADPLIGAGTLFNFRFNVSSLAVPGTDTVMTWQTFKFNEGNPGNSTTNVTLHVLQATSANVAIGGRLLSAYGQPVSNTRITMTGVNGVSRSTLSSSMGYYNFDDVEVGQTYILAVKTRRFRFQPIAVSINDELTELNLIAEP